MDEMSFFEDIVEPGDESIGNGTPAFDLPFPSMNDIGELADLALLQAAIHGERNLDRDVGDDVDAERKVVTEREADAEEDEDAGGGVDAEGEADADGDTEVADIKIEDTDVELLQSGTKPTPKDSSPIDADIDMLGDEALSIPPPVRFEVAIPELAEEEKREYSMICNSTTLNSLMEESNRYVFEQLRLHMHTRTSLSSMRLPQSLQAL
ncbi:hypothetical protein J3F83DRAFT_257625 [Trichoderma novae-zelandiae]